MAQTNLNICIDEEIIKQFDNFCDDVGMSASTAVSIFIKATLKAHRIPFEISTLDENGFTPAEAKEFIRRKNDFEKGGGVYHELLGDN